MFNVEPKRVGVVVSLRGGTGIVVLVPDPKPTPAWIAFSIVCTILEAIYAPDEVWGRDYSYS